MAKIPAKVANLSVNGVAIEDELDKIDLKIEQEIIKVDGFASTGPERVVGNYDYSLSVGGNADFAASQGDATIFSMVGDANGGAMAFDPTGNSAAASDPNYDSSAIVLKSYSISAAVGQAVKYSADFEGAAALARNVS